MTMPSIKQQILDDLDRLSPDLQRKARDLVHGLVVSPSRPEGTPGRDLLPVEGILDDGEARRMEQVIEEGCERIDLDGW